MQRVNIVGSNRLLETAAAKGVAHAVVASSALAVGVNRRPEPLDETANWAEHAFDFPYANMRRQAEQEALARATPGFAVVAVCPAFTFGPDDPVGAPANSLLKTLIKRQAALYPPGGIWLSGCPRLCERHDTGRPARPVRTALSPQRPQRHDQPAARAGRGHRGRSRPALCPAALPSHTRWSEQSEIFSKLRGKPSPITRDVLQIYRALRLVRHIARSVPSLGGSRVLSSRRSRTPSAGSARQRRAVPGRGRSTHADPLRGLFRAATPDGFISQSNTSDEGVVRPRSVRRVVTPGCRITR